MDDKKVNMQSPYLNIMGIQQWVRRDSTENSTTNSDDNEFSRYVEESKVATSPLLVITTSLDGEERILLDNMLQAIEISGAEVQQITILKPELLSQQEFQQYLVGRIRESSAQAVIQLGGDVINHTLVEYTFHPSHLMQHKSDKRHAWEALKRVKKRIDG